MMNMQPVVQSRSSNGYGRRRDTGNKLENKLQTGKTNPSRSTSTGVLGGGKNRGHQNLSRERLVYVTTCLIGQQVDVHVTNGSIYAGIFYATNAEKDFGVVLKMARLTKDASSRGDKSITEFVTRAPSKTLIIPSNELVQIVAKDVAVTRDGMSSNLHAEKEQDIMIDSYISHSRHAEGERELGRWVPDEDDPQCPELDNTFDSPWNRSWDQFRANEALFGVKSTFDEELYTTKLEKGPQMREVEREAARIAREIEGEETHDLHLAEERGVLLDEKFDFDEEARYSSVFRGVDDSGYAEDEEIFVDSNNTETFGSSSGSIISRSFINVVGMKSNDGAQASSSSSSLGGHVLQDDAQSSHSSYGQDLYRAGSRDHSGQLPSSFTALESERILDIHSNELGKDNSAKELLQKQKLSADVETLSHDDSPLSNSGMDDVDKGPLLLDTTVRAPSSGASKDQEKIRAPGEVSAAVASGRKHGEKQSVNTRFRANSSSTSDRAIASSASSGPTLSSSSSVGSLSSEKSSLNPYAKEFKLNPNAKSFVPSQSPMRPVSPVSDGSLYYPSSGSAVPHMHGMPMGFGMGGPSFPGQQPLFYSLQAAPMQSPQSYFPPNGPPYGQPMILTRPYMQGYPHEMPYKGRDY